MPPTMILTEMSSFFASFLHDQSALLDQSAPPTVFEQGSKQAPHQSGQICLTTCLASSNSSLPPAPTA
jgi:hypothetical protein